MTRASAVLRSWPRGLPGGVVRADLLRTHSPDGFNVGVNDGEMAGQTVMHAHVHVIPRYRGDVADSHRGMRLMVPDRADDWKDS